jgi:hypothetical protein
MMSKDSPNDPFQPLNDLTKLIEQFKLPGVDMAAIAASHGKDMDTLVQSNQAMLELMQELAKKQAEIFASALKTAQENFLSLAKGPAAPDPAKVNDIVRVAYDNAVAQMTELTDMARKAQGAAMERIARRAGESAKEINAALQRK